MLKLRLMPLPADFISAVHNRLHDYASLSPKSRYETLTGLWNRLQRETEETFPPLPHPVDLPPKQYVLEACFSARHLHP